MRSPKLEFLSFSHPVYQNSLCFLVFLQSYVSDFLCFLVLVDRRSALSLVFYNSYSTVVKKGSALQSQSISPQEWTPEFIEFAFGRPIYSGSRRAQKKYTIKRP